MNQDRRIAKGFIAFAVCLSTTLLVAAPAFASARGGHATVRRSSEMTAAPARTAQEAQYAEQVKALNAGIVSLPNVVEVSATDKQRALWKAQVDALNAGTVSLPDVRSTQPAQSVQIGRPAVPFPGTLSYWVTIGILSGLLALTMAAAASLYRRRPRPRVTA